MLLAAVNTANEGDLLCKILLVGLAISLIVGLAQALGVSFGNALGGTRFGGLLVFVVLLVIYAVFC